MTHRLIVLKYAYLRLEHEDIFRMTDHHLVCKEDGSPLILGRYPTLVRQYLQIKLIYPFKLRCLLMSEELAVTA